MLKKLMTAAAAVSVLATAGAAAAQPYGYWGGGRHYYDNGYRGDYGGYRGDYRRYDGYRGDGYRYRHWRRGERVPYAYRGAYVDWRAYHLRRPPYGYEWRRTDTGDYILAAIATGLIASVILNNR
jgi:Ni/Co efflux regulator RcnB